MFAPCYPVESLDGSECGSDFWCAADGHVSSIAGWLPFNFVCPVGCAHGASGNVFAVP